jgi:hypothetical protein
MRRVVLTVCAVAAIAIGAVTAQAMTSRAHSDANRHRASIGQRRSLRAILHRLAASPHRGLPAVGNRSLCAIAAIAGPGTSPNIRIGLFNVRSGQIAFMTLDSFDALGNASLIHQSVFAQQAPQGGSITTFYPLANNGKGPVVLGFKGFDPLESAAFNTDPDTYDNPNFGATVSEMAGTRIELAYTKSTRCEGTLQFNAGLQATVGAILETHP